MSGAQRPYPVLENLVIELQTTSSEYEGLAATLTDNHPDLIILMRQISNIKNNIKQAVNSLERSLEERITTLKSRIDLEDNKLLSFPQKEQNLANLERVYTVNERLLSYLLQRQSEVSLREASKVSDIRILDKPTVEFVAAKPNKIIVLMISLFLGLVVSFLVSLLRLNKQIKTVEDLSDATSIPLFGIIPYVKNKEHYNMAYVLQDATSTASEAFRAIRTNLDYMISDNESKVILVTSSIPNEGKTVVSANLAAMLGMSEKKTIILSLDLRRPEMHHKFGLSNKVGISDVLSNKVPLNEVIWEHEIHPNLHIITSGKVPPNPAELLSSSRFKKVITKLRKRYDYIILDTPPINYVADAMVLFKHADVNLFVVKSDFTEEKYVKELNKLINKFRLDNTGIILNSVKKKHNKLEQFDNKYLYFEPL